MNDASGFNRIMGFTEQIARAVHAVPLLDEDALRRDYAAQGLDREEDTFCLVRVVGNDLPPRHRVGQARENVGFTLENEAAFPNCTKHWVINRIVVPEEEEALIRLIASFGASYEVIPFDAGSYARVGWDFESFEHPVASEPELLRSLGGERADTALDQLYRHKNCYVMNNNGARNAALRAGQARAKWALPWDGNCFVTLAAWQAISEAVTSRPHLPYFIVPMARVLDNLALLSNDFVPNAVEEPQVIFRRDAPDEFDERYRYGRRPKVEFLWRLGVPGPWDAWRNNSWDTPFPSLSPRAGQFAGAGWVARLFSGEGHLEAADRSSAKSRALARQTAISTFIDGLDARVLGASTGPDALLILDDGVLAEQAQAASGALSAVKHVLLAKADEAAAGGMSLPSRLFILALAWRLHGKEDLARHAQTILSEVLAAPQDDGSAAGDLLVEGETWYLVEAVRLMRRAQAIPDEVAERFGKVLVSRLDRAETNASPARADYRVARELDLLACAHFLGRWPDVAGSLRRLGERVFHGRFPLACGRESPGNDIEATAAELQRWANAAQVCERLGTDLWNERGASGRGLEQAFEKLLATAWAKGAAVADPLRAAMRGAYPCFDPDQDNVASSQHQQVQLFPSESSVRPFWSLG